ncbi:MAG: TolC family protein [Desulfobacteraceae bacterium]|nr:TolC family protein [Desulfobacteraceae bacterium]
MNKVSIQIFLVILIVFFNQIPVFGQTTYSLYDLMQLAGKHSETIKIAQDDVYLAQQDKSRALSVLIPRATTYGSMTKYKDEDMSMPNTLTAGIKLTQSFTLNGKELIALDVTKRTIESKEFSLESVKSNYLLQVAQAYYTILSSQRILEITQSDVKRLKTHRDGVKEKLNVGNVTKTDLYRAEAELSKSMTEKVRAENQVLLRKAGLQNLVEIEDDFNLRKENIEGIETYQTTLEDIQMYALKNRTEIKEAKKNLDIATKTIRFEKSAYWPSISLEAGYKETDIEYKNQGSDVEYDTEDYYVTGELTFTLFDGGLRRADIRKAIADQRKAKNALILQKKQIILDSKISYLDYETAKSTLINLQDELKSAQENYNAVQMQFKYGMADSIDMMDANTLLVTSQRRISDATYIQYLSVLKILHTKGELVKFF